MTDTPDLDALYDAPSEKIQKAVLNRLVDVHESYIRAATFFCFATGRESGLDASPRGGEPGFVQVLDPHHVAFADWPGNNRIESMRNIEEDARVGMLFLFPGMDVFLRINGRARLSVDPELRERLKEGKRVPKLATVVEVEEVLFHCGKAANRARLWHERGRIDRKSLPTVGQVLASLIKLGEEDVAELDAQYDRAMKTELY